MSGERADGDLLERLLAGTLPDPDGGAPLSVPVRAVAIEASLDGTEADRVRALDLGRRLAVVSDPDTHAALGARIERALASLGPVEPVRLPRRPHADAETVERIRGLSAGADALVAVGSGTVNDLCKQAAALDGKPWAVFGTAPSMNGYTSVNAAITVAGHKRSLPARAAEGVFLDLGVLAGAPPRMIRAGLGDSLCRCTAQRDWLLASLVRGDRYREAPFRLLAADEEDLLEGAGALLAGDLEAMRRLARTLVLSGLGMTVCGGSMPASQGEHLISHYAEMRPPEGADLPFHGEQIGVTTLTMAELQEELLAGDAPVLADRDPDQAEVLARFGPEVGAACWRELSAKRLAGAGLDAANERLARGWGAFVERCRRVSRPRATLARALERAGAPRRPAELGWSRDFYREAVLHAREIRARYTFLDLAAQAGRLADLAARG